MMSKMFLIFHVVMDDVVIVDDVHADDVVIDDYRVIIIGCGCGC